MNHAQVYAAATGKVLQEALKKEDALEKKLALEWIQHPSTQELIKHLDNLQDNYMHAASAQATSYPSHEKPHTMIHALVRADTVNKILTYIKTK